jgi:hypothetical protein
MVSAAGKNHPWALVGPWYRLDSVGGPPPRRSTAPIFQKYSAVDFANRITKEPQESLKFNCEDFVTRLCQDPDQVVTPEMREANPEPFKLFRDLHSRFYLVVCELHCVAPGFPSVDREQVCEAGFVVRRRVPNVPEAVKKQLAAMMQERRFLKAQILKASGNPTDSGSQAVTVGGIIKNKINQTLDKFQQKRRSALLKELEKTARI